MMKVTPWHYYRHDGVRHRMKVYYGVDYVFARQHNQLPYFSMTGEIDEQRGNGRWTDWAGGRIDWDIERRLPSLAPYLKWNGVGPEGHMHYFANAKYWFEVAQGKEQQGGSATDPIQAFRRTISLGVFPGDLPPLELQEDLNRIWRKPEAIKYRGPKEWSPSGSREKAFFRGVPWSRVQAWLEERLSKLEAAWVVDMGELGVLE